ncbi:MAG TPA: SET domain-containing protein-lysine N-methyltransferase, partial [Actinomycetota bacterium]
MLGLGWPGFTLRRTEAKGDGVFATRPFRRGETVMIGEIGRRLDANDTHASQVGPSEYVLLAGLGPKVNHSCDPNCGVRLNASGAYDLLARRDIATKEEIT